MKDKDILSKLKTWSKSSTGKQRIQGHIDDVRSGKIGQGGSGDKIITFKDMEQAAQQMIRILQNMASIHKLPASVLDHFNSLAYSSPIRMPNGMCRTDIYFKDDLSRMSLLAIHGRQKGQRTGMGIENIVSLFDTGYLAQDTVFGIWDGHEALGPIESLRGRPGKRFMRKAIEAFNLECGEKYAVEAMISADQDFYGDD